VGDADGFEEGLKVDFEEGLKVDFEEGLKGDFEEGLDEGFNEGFLLINTEVGLVVGRLVGGKVIGMGLSEVARNCWKVEFDGGAEALVKMGMALPPEKDVVM